MLAGNDVVFIQLPSGQAGPAGGMQIDFGPRTNHLQIASGQVRIESVATGGALSTTVASEAQLFTNRLYQNGLTVVGSGRVSLLPGSVLASVVTSLDLVGGATLDLNESALIIDYSGASPLSAIRERLISGRGGVGLGNGTWTGTGITSSAVAALNSVAPESHSVGYADNAMLPLGSYANFHGQPVDGTAILLAPTLSADANLDGVVNDDEVTIVGALYQPGAPNPQWQWGDFDYNGSIDDDDVTILGALYNPTSLMAFAPPEPLVDAGNWIDVGEISLGNSSKEFRRREGADYFGTAESNQPDVFGLSADSFRIDFADDEALLNALAYSIAGEPSRFQDLRLAGDRMASARRNEQIENVWIDSLWRQEG
jgi:hypothetical protein